MNLKIKRIAALIAALLLLASSLAGLFRLTAYADNTADYEAYSATLYNEGTNAEVSRALKSDGKTVYKIVIIFRPKNATPSIPNIPSPISVKVALSDELYTKGSRVVASIKTENRGGKEHFILTIDKVYYDSIQKGSNCSLIVDPFDVNGTHVDEIKIESAIPINSKYHTDASTGSDDDGPQLWVPDIVVDRVNARDSKDNIIDFLDKDTTIGKLEIVYTDFGVLYEDVEDLDEEDLVGYLVSESGFTSPVSNKGVLRLINPDNSAGSDYARFRLTFTNVRWDGSATSLRFRTQYYMYNGERVSGNATAPIPQAQLADDETEITPPTPYIIITQYNYGRDYIEAGSEFALDISFKNTSSVIPLENIVITITPAEELTIATASNSVYIDSLAEGASMGHQIRLQAKASSPVGSKPVEIKFAYEYLVDKKREKGETTEKIAVPITQIDRFAVDPITDMPEYMEAGETYYFTLNFINRGKSTVYNISGVNSLGEQVPDTQHFGNLEAGKTGYLEFALVAQEPGSLIGKIVLQYEDENMNGNEVILPYEVFVEQAWMPPAWDNVPGDDPGIVDEGPAIDIFQLALCSLGGLMVAVPLALYIIKRVKAKGNEDELDEDF